MSESDAAIPFRILGPLSIQVAGRDVVIPAGRDRIVLAMLLLHPGGIVGLDELTAAVWGTHPPVSPKSQVQSCVYRLRRVLPAEAIVSDRAGYGIRVGADELDMAVFERLLAAARAGRDPVRYRAALDLWRGDALAGIESPAVRQAAAVLDERRTVAIEDWIDAELDAGDARTLLGELTGLVVRFPLRERLREQLMVALSRAGRRADALAEYRRAGKVLRDELGIEPGPALQRLHRRLLGGEPAGASPSSRSPTPAVRCLPRTVADFTGREAVVRRLLGRTAAPRSAGPVVVALDGMAGSGKTTLAVHIASLVGDRYPDAHLFVDLHGHGEEQPLPPAAALLILLRQLGVPTEAIPPDLVDRVGLWRTELASRRVLLLLDNARSSAQLADLLPTSADSLALVTSRRRLTGLDGVHAESIDVLDRDEAVALLARIAGDRVHAEPEAAAEVVRRCGHLPLAIRLAGSRLVHRSGWQVAELARRLGGAALPELTAEDRTVAGAFALSYDQLPARTRQVFRLLGAYPGADFDALAIAALTDLPLEPARQVLDELVDVHLVDEPDAGVFRMHDLIREYAAVLAGDLPVGERHAAVRRVLDQQMHAAAATVGSVGRAELIRDLRSPQPLRPDLLAALTDPAARLERERPNLAAFVEAAVAVDPGYAWKIPRAAWRRLWLLGYLDDVATLQRRALSVAERLGDRSAAATAGNYLASAPFARADYEEARRILLESIRLREGLGETAAVVTAMQNLAAVYAMLGRWRESLETCRAADRLRRKAYTPSRSSSRLNVLAIAYLHLGRFPEAIRHLRLRLMVAVEIRDVAIAADTLQELAVAKFRAGIADVERTKRQLDLVLRLYRRTGDASNEATTRNEFGNFLALSGHYAEAIEEHHRALDAALRLHFRLLESIFRCDLATTMRLAGDATAGRTMAEHALRVARELRLPYQIARAQASLAECLLPTEPDHSRRLWVQALETFAELGAAERADVEKRLAALSPPPVLVGSDLG